MSEGIVVLACGGREFDNQETVFAALDRAATKRPIRMLIQGGAKGADRLAAKWAHATAIPYLTAPANWEKHGDAAGPIRNQWMLDQQPDAVIAFPGGRGTAHMVKISRDAGIPVWEPCRG